MCYWQSGRIPQPPVGPEEVRIIIIVASERTLAQVYIFAALPHTENSTDKVILYIRFTYVSLCASLGPLGELRHGIQDELLQ